jgi:hypothetical protein
MDISIRAAAGIKTVWEFAFGPLCAGSMTVAIAICKHLIQAVVLFFGAPEAAGSINFHAMLEIIPLGPINPHYVLASLLVLVAGAASFAMHNRKLDHKTVCALLLPQQTLLILVWIGAISAVLVGHYADGYVPHGGSWFIAGDQAMRLLLPPFYTIALIARATAREGGYDN